MFGDTLVPPISFFMTSTQRKLLQEVVRDGLKIQSRFSAAPVCAITGQVSLKSEGVATLQQIKLTDSVHL
jgi:hypothetical protein